MCYDAAEIDWLPKFRDNILVPSTGENIFFISQSLKITPVHRPETSVTNPRHTSGHNSEELFHFKGADVKLYVMCESGWKNLYRFMR